VFGESRLLVDGAMCIGVDTGGLIIRRATDATDALLAKEGVRELTSPVRGR
jgi:TfoX/Sxy family transcriptional regulator of competence genes